MALLVHRHLHLDVLVAGMGGGEHVLQAVFHPLHRTAQVEREVSADKFFRVDGCLLAETAAGVGNDDADVGLVQPQMLGEIVPHDVWKLVAHPYGQRERAFPISGDAAPALQAERLLAADAELALDHEMGVTKRFVHIAALVFALDQVVVRARVVHERGIVALAQARDR